MSASPTYTDMEGKLYLQSCGWTQQFPDDRWTSQYALVAMPMRAAVELQMERDKTRMEFLTKYLDPPPVPTEQISQPEGTETVGLEPDRYRDELKTELDAVAVALHPHWKGDGNVYSPKQLPGMIEKLQLVAKAARAWEKKRYTTAWDDLFGAREILKRALAAFSPEPEDEEPSTFAELGAQVFNERNNKPALKIGDIVFYRGHERIVESCNGKETNDRSPDYGSLMWNLSHANGTWTTSHVATKELEFIYRPEPTEKEQK